MTMVNSLLTHSIYKRFLGYSRIKDKLIPKFYPQLQGKIEAYNKIAKSEFLAVGEITSIDDGKLNMICLSKHMLTKGTCWYKGANTNDWNFSTNIQRCHIGKKTKQKTVTYVCI